MIIIANKAGQLANRMFSFSHFIAHSIENGHKVLNPNFDDYAQHFEATASNNFHGHNISLKLSSMNWLDKWLRILLNPAIAVLGRVLKKTPFYQVIRITESHDKHERHFQLNDPDFTNLAKHNTLFTQGWLFHDSENFNKHADKIRRIFSPQEKYRQNVDTLENNIRKSCDILVGIHMRKGDYKDFLGGKYYYDTAVYVAKVKSLKAQIEARGKKAGFVLCSNEAIPIENFDGLNAHLSTNHFIEDLYTLSRCDFILGPPSTYSMWASFYGQGALLLMEDPNKDIRLEDFEVYKEKENE